MSLVSDAVREAWENASSVDDACANLERMIETDHEIYRAVMQPHVSQAIRSLINGSKISERKSIWDRSMPNKAWQRPTAPDSRVEVLARINTLTILDMRLRSGKRLADATFKDVANERDYYASVAEHMTEKANFFAKVAERLDATNTKTVAEAFNINDLEAIRVAA